MSYICTWFMIAEGYEVDIVEWGKGVVYMYSFGLLSGLS